MKRNDENLTPKARRKSIKLIDFTTPDNDDEEMPINRQDPDQLLFTVKKEPPVQDPYLHIEIQQALQTTENELNALKTLYDEQQLIVNTYRQKEQSTNQMISSMKKDMISLEQQLNTLQIQNEELVKSHQSELKLITNKHNVHVKALQDVHNLLKKDNTRLESKSQMSESQLKEATAICNELMAYFSKNKGQNDNENENLFSK